MNRTIIRFAKSLLRHAGVEVHRVRKGVGQDAFADMRTLTTTDTPVIFDVGGNVGQSVALFAKSFRRPVIHSFEPGVTAFRELEKNTAGIPDLYRNRVGLAARGGSRTFIENELTNMSSVLEPGADCWGEIRQRYEVEMTTIDDYCASAGVTNIDILKVDTQGSELDVIHGAEGMLRAGAIHLVYVEIIFSEMYEGLPRLDEMYGFLADRGFTLVSFYDFYYQRERAAWTDALFIHSPAGS